MKRKDDEMQQKTTNDDLYNHVQKLELGQEVNNYKQLCALLNQPVLPGGDQKKVQIKDFRRYFQFEKSGYKFIITDIFDTPLAKEDKRTMSYGRERYKIESDNYLIDPKDNNACGVFKIQFGNLVYIGKTTQGFRRAYQCSYNDYNGMIPVTKEMLNNGATFEILWKATEEDSYEDIKNQRLNYLNKYKKMGYDIANKSFGKSRRQIREEHNKTIFN